MKHKCRLLLLLLLACCACSVRAAQGGGRGDGPRPTGSPKKTADGKQSRRVERAAPAPATPKKGPGRSADAELTIISTAPNCAVYINGQARGTTNTDGLLNITALAPGRYEIVLRKEGHTEGRRTVQVVSGQSQLASIEMQPIHGGSVTVEGGIMNKKALSLPIPEYPAEARGTGAGGKVTLKVLVDKSGEVISAEAESGHSALHQAAVDAARRARFSQTIISGQPVQVTGSVSYEFQPHSTTQTYRAQSGRFQIDFPSSWGATPRGSDYVTLAPPNGLRQRGRREEIIVGAIAAYLPVQGGNRMTPEQTLEATLKVLLRGNEYLRELASARRQVQIAGGVGMEAWLVGHGPDGYEERAHLIVRPTPTGLVFMIFAAPERDFGTHQSIFQQMAQGLIVVEK